MMGLVFNVTNLVQRIKDARTHGYDLSDSVDETSIDPSLTECWVVIGEGLPKVNGTYQFQKEYNKQSAEDLCELINVIHINGFSHAQNNMKSSMGIRDHDDKIHEYSDPAAEAMRKRRRDCYLRLLQHPDVDPSV
jgi:hypothetical protein